MTDGMLHVRWQRQVGRYGSHCLSTSKVYMRKPS